MNNTLKDSLTVAFSGYNIRGFVILAVKSFLKYYPDLASNIVVFDDDSTDGTAKWLEDNKIKRITWSSENKFFYNTTHRVAALTKEIIESCDTQYLLLNDGDVVFTSGGFLERYQEYLPQYKAMFKMMPYVVGPGTFPESLDYIYKHRIDGLVDRPSNYHMLLDIKHLREQEIVYDELVDEFARRLGSTADTGMSLYFKLREKNVPLYCWSESVFADQTRVNDTQDINHVHHFYWVSSLIRNAKDYGGVHAVLPGWHVKEAILSLNQIRNVAEIAKEEDLSFDYILDIFSDEVEALAELIRQSGTLVPKSTPVSEKGREE